MSDVPDAPRVPSAPVAAVPAVPPAAAPVPGTDTGPGGPEGRSWEEPRVPLRTLLVYSLPAVGAGYAFFLVLLFLLKYGTDVLLVAPAAMGAIFMAGRVWDAVTDPLAGYWSDRTRTRWGRRRPWMLASAIPAGLAFVMMWAPPRELGSAEMVAWMAAAVLLFYTAMTGLLVPHTSLGAELTTNYHDRTRIFGVRQIAWYLGVFGALGSMQAITSVSGDPRGLAAGLGWAGALFLVLTIVVAVRGLGEREEFQGRGGRRPYRAFADVLRNPHARLLLGVFLIESMGGATVGVLTIYMSEYVLGTPRLTTVYIGSYMLCAAGSVPLWIALSRRTGKKQLWFGSMVVTSVGFGSTFLLGEGDWLPLVVIAAVLGLAAGCGNIVGPSIQADIIDWDEHRTGERKEGAYFAAWNFCLKLATGLTLGITGFALQAAGFRPNEAQDPDALLAIRGLYALFPLVCYAVGALAFLRFSFNEGEYAAVRRDLEARKEGREAP